MAKKSKELVHAEKDVPAVRQDLFATLRQQMDEAFEQMQALEERLLQSPLIQGFSVFPHGERLQMRPFGHLLDALEAGWREPFLRYEVKGGALEVTAEVPGIRKEDIKLDVGPDHLRLEAENGDSRYKAFLEPGMSLDPDRAEATCQDGVLDIRIPLKAEQAKRVRTIKVE